jgi:hypothetical protein
MKSVTCATLLQGRTGRPRFQPGAGGAGATHVCVCRSGTTVTPYKAERVHGATFHPRARVWGWGGRGGRVVTHSRVAIGLPCLRECVPLFARLT